MTDLPGPFTRRTRVLDVQGSRGTLRELQETSSREQPLQWTCTSEKASTGNVVEERNALTLHASSGELRCEVVELAVAEANARWRDAGPSANEGCRDWRWSPPPTARKKVLVCGEGAFLAAAPGVERPTSDTDCDDGAHRLRKIAPDGRVLPYYPKR